MTWRSGVLAMCLMCLTRAPAATAEPNLADSTDGFVSMFNGKDLSGWEGAPGWWEVRDGLLVAESTPDKPCRKSHYLYWTGGEPANFDLRVTYRIGGEANSGIQFRSEKRPQWNIWGYQADLDSAGIYTGCVYQHDRGLVAQRGERVRIDAAGKRTVAQIGDSNKLLAAIRANDWNDYRILAEGSRITLWLNDILMCEVENQQQPLASERGVIALQMHQGPPMKVEFKGLRIRVLD